MKLLASVEVKPLVGLTTRGLTLDYLRKFNDEAGALRDGVMLLLDSTKSHTDYGAALCRCQFERCSRFYLARRNRKGGPANRIYCDPVHSQRAHEAGRADRARRQKARREK